MKMTDLNDFKYFYLDDFYNELYSRIITLEKLKSDISSFYNEIENLKQLDERSCKVIINKYFILEMYTHLESFSKNIIRLVYKKYKTSFMNNDFLVRFFTDVIDKPYIRKKISDKITSFSVDFEEAFTFSNSMDLDQLYKLLSNLNIDSEDLRSALEKDINIGKSLKKLKETEVSIVPIDSQKNQAFVGLKKLKENTEIFVKNIVEYRHSYAHSGSAPGQHLYNSEQMLSYIDFFISLFIKVAHYVSCCVLKNLLDVYITKQDEVKTFEVSEIRRKNNPNKLDFSSRILISGSDILFSSKYLYILEEYKEEPMILDNSVYNPSALNEINRYCKYSRVKICSAEDINNKQEYYLDQESSLKKGDYSIHIHSNLKLNQRFKYKLHIFSHEDKEYNLTFG